MQVNKLLCEVNELHIKCTQLHRAEYNAWLCLDKHTCRVQGLCMSGICACMHYLMRTTTNKNDLAAWR